MPRDHVRQPLCTKKGSKLLQKNGKTLEGNFIMSQQPQTCTENFKGPSGGHYGPRGPKPNTKPQHIGTAQKPNTSMRWIMEANMKASLDSVCLPQIQRCVYMIL